MAPFSCSKRTCSEPGHEIRGKTTTKAYERALPASIDLVIPGYKGLPSDAFLEVPRNVPRGIGEWKHLFAVEYGSIVGSQFP